MRSLLRAGAIALAAGSLLLSSAVAAQAAPAGINVKVDGLILDPRTYGHLGVATVYVENATDQPYRGRIRFTEPISGTSTGVLKGALGCTLSSAPDGRRITSCPLAGPIAPGATATVTLGFWSPARPRPYAQEAPLRGSVTVGTATEEFPALFRSTVGSLADPVPYEQNMTPSLDVTAPRVVILDRQADGTYMGHAPITVRNDTDAPHHDLSTQITFPDKLEWPEPTPAGVCGLGAPDLPEQQDTTGISCWLPDSRLAETQTRVHNWVLRAPAEMSPGFIGVATTRFDLGDPAAPQTSGTNHASFQIYAVD